MPEVGSNPAVSGHASFYPDEARLVLQDPISSDAELVNKSVEMPVGEDNREGCPKLRVKKRSSSRSAHPLTST